MQIGLTQDEQEYLTSVDVRSLLVIISAYEDSHIYEYETERLPKGTCDLLHHLGAYLAYYQKSHGGLKDLIKNFNTDVFEVFVPDMVLTQDLSSKSFKPNTTSSGMSIRIKDYPSFNGKTQAWTLFQQKFTATAELQGIDYLLTKTDDHEEKFQSDDSYINDCHLLFSILKYACSTGLALPKVNQFKSSKDGYKAWNHLYDHYYGQGDVQEFANDCLERLLSLTLTSSSPGGMDTFLSDFETHLLELQDIDPLTDAQKKTFLLRAVKDPNYKAVKTMCRG